MADHHPREHATAHGVHTQDLKPEHKTEAVKHEASATPAAEQESSSHHIHDGENHGHESESDKSGSHSNESHGGIEHTADKRTGKLGGKSTPSSIKGGGGPPGVPGRPKS